MTIIPNSLKLIGNPDLECFTTFKEFVAAIPSMFGVDVPNTITNVVVSNIQPTDTQRTAVWFRMSNGGSFIGIYLFTEGAWRQVFPVEGQGYRIFGGDSRDPPFGYIPADQASFLSAAEKTFIRQQWFRDPTDTFYTIYDVVPVSG